MLYFSGGFPAEDGILKEAAPLLLEALEEISAGNPASPGGKWLSDIEMAEIARAATKSLEGIAAVRGEGGQGLVETKNPAGDHRDDASEWPKGRNPVRNSGVGRGKDRQIKPRLDSMLA